MSKHHKNRADFKNENNKNRKEFVPSKKLAQETTHSIWALIFLAVAILLGLAGVSLAGNVGGIIFNSLYELLGWGYSLLPLTLLSVSATLLMHKEERAVYVPTLWGAILFFISALGFIDVLFDKRGGDIGSVAGYPKMWFGPIAWASLLFIAVIIGIIVVFDQPIRIKFGKKE